mgnify:CR=1 FL=1
MQVWYVRPGSGVTCFRDPRDPEGSAGFGQLRVWLFFQRVLGIRSRDPGIQGSGVGIQGFAQGSGRDSGIRQEIPKLRVFLNVFRDSEGFARDSGIRKH